MRWIFFFASVFLVMQSFSQNKMLEKAKNTSGSSTTAEQERIYVNENWQPVAPAQASYYLVKQFVRNVMLVSGVPTYDQGMQMKAEETPLVKYLYKYHYLSDQLAFSVEVTAMKNNLDEFVYDGAAVWYNEDGSLLAKGAFDSGKLNGDYIEYDKQGNITVQKKYMAGEEFDGKAGVYEPLLGKWVMITKTQYSGEKHLVNIFKDDGSMIIGTESYSVAFDEPMRLSSNLDNYLYKYTSTGDGKGVIEVFYEDGKLLGKETAEVNGNQFISVITEHISPSLVGKKYVFKRVNN